MRPGGTVRWSEVSGAIMESKGLVLTFIVLILSLGTVIISDKTIPDKIQATSAEELQLARQLCPPASDGGVACVESEMDIAPVTLRGFLQMPLSTLMPQNCDH